MDAGDVFARGAFCLFAFDRGCLEYADDLGERKRPARGDFVFAYEDDDSGFEVDVDAGGSDVEEVTIFGEDAKSFHKAQIQAFYQRRASEMSPALSFYLGRRGVSRSGGNCISAAAAPSLPAPVLAGFIATAAAVLMCAAAAVSFFGCHPVAAKSTAHTEVRPPIDFVTPNPDVPASYTTMKAGAAGAPTQSPDAGKPAATFTF